MAASHSLPAKWAEAPVLINDPGTGAAIPVDRSPIAIALTIAASASETNTLAAPTGPNYKLKIYAATVGSSGTRTITASSGVTADGDTTIVFNAAGDYVVLESFPIGSGSYRWRVVAQEGVTGSLVDGVFDDLTAATLTLGTSVFDSDALATGAGAGVTGGTGTVYKSSTMRNGDMFKTTILVDLTGLGSSTTDLDIIGQGVSVAHIGKLTAAECGATILSVQMTCLEAPATGVTDIDLYSATEGTGVFDAGIGTLVETAVITSGGAWTNGASKGATTVPLATEYLYLVNGAAGTVGTFTAGKFKIEIIGYT
jgi:hypothetical protein